ncbi:ArsR/SmtB family transcription factor [Microcella sp.]|uniref:ArsR/SmtB family transcription factor n=1 Tax=Microcella sp. TaxID=1913979 RepID=UPI002565399D|nr:metalloregulator ArsR/SmtB family transcription factor [Microcella sp.]MBX9470421.1 metalloregulator ArsR/SmtB family transcription factor [Microcella sp.]
MVVEIARLSDAEVDAIFGALADATRRDIVERVIEREQSVSSLAASYAMSFAAVQKHVAVLERASLVVKSRSGREQIVRANPDSLQRARSLLESYESLWRHRATTIDAILAEGPEQ